MPGRNDDRANLGEQSSNSGSVESEERVVRPSQADREDQSAGDEGIDEASSMRGTERSESERNDVRERGRSTRGRKRSSGRNLSEEGTGFTGSDRSEEDIDRSNM
jgi:hypothetical protein